MKNKLLLLLFTILISTNISVAGAFFKKYDWSSKPTLSSLSASEAQETSVVLKDLRAMEYIYDDKGDLSMYITKHKITRIIQDRAVDENNKVFINVNTPEDLVSFKARTITRDGKVIELNKSNMKFTSEEGKNYLILAIEGLVKDSEIELLFTVRRGLRFFGSEYLQSGVLTKNVEFMIISPENLQFEAVSYNGFPEMKDSMIDSVNRLSAQSAVVKGMNHEKYAAYYAGLMRVDYKLSYNLAKGKNKLFNWFEAGKKYHDAIFEKRDESQKAIAAFVKELKISKMTPEDQIRRIESYLKENIKVIEDAPDDHLASCLKKKHASDGDYMKLYAYAFDYLDIPFEIVLTCDRKEKKFDPSFDNWSSLAEYIFYFPNSGKYMIHNNLLFRYGIIPDNYTANNGLFIKSVKLGKERTGVGSVRMIEALPLEKNFDNVVFNVAFTDKADKVKIQMKRSFGGYQALGIRPYYYYTPVDKRPEISNSIVKMTAKDAEVSNVKVINPEMNTAEVEKDFIIEADLISGSLIEKAGKNIVFKVGEIIGEQVEMYQEKARQFPVELDNLHSYLREINIKIPQGYTVKGLDKLDINYVYKDDQGKTMGFTSEWKKTDDVIKISVYEFYDRINYPIADFEKFRKVINAAADFNKVALVFAKE